MEGCKENDENISVNDYQNLHVAVGWKIIDDKQIEIALKHSMFISCAKQENQVIGMARIVGDFGRHGVLTDVIVLPQFQKMGVGRKLIEDLMGQVQDFVNKRDEFLVEFTPTPENIGFYQKCGFKNEPSKMYGMYKWFKNQNVYQEGCKKHFMNLNDSPFKMIKSGQKKIEMRLFDEKRQKIKVGDIIIFQNKVTEERLWCRVKGLHRFDNFTSLYKAFDKDVLGYKKGENADPSDMGQYYSKEQQAKFGVLGIEIEVMK